MGNDILNLAARLSIDNVDELKPFKITPEYDRELDIYRFRFEDVETQPEVTFETFLDKWVRDKLTPERAHLFKSMCACLDRNLERGEMQGKEIELVDIDMTLTYMIGGSPWKVKI